MVAGFVVGSYGWLVGARSFTEQLPQMFYSAIKIPMLLAVTVCISMPFFFVANTLMGLRNDFRDAFRAIILAQAGLSIILCSLVPFLILVYASVTNRGYGSAVLFNAFLFGVASLSAQILLRVHYRPLIHKDRRHRFMVWAWIIVYAFVGIQVGWTARPFIGNTSAKITFFRDEPFSNAYMQMIRLARDAAGL